MDDLDPLIHQPARLRLLTALHSLEADAEADFVFLRELLKLTDGNLGAHLAKLEEAGYVRVRKLFVEKKPRTLVSLSPKGREAFTRHVAALRALLPKD